MSDREHENLDDSTPTSPDILTPSTCSFPLLLEISVAMGTSEIPIMEVYPRTNPKQIALFDDKTLKHLLHKTYRESTSFSTDLHGFSRLLETGRFSDVKLLIGPFRIAIKAHRGVLAERSGYFEDLFSSAKGQQLDEVLLDQCNYEVVKNILHYLYTGKIAHSFHPGYVARLHLEAKFFQIPALMDHAILHFEKVLGPSCSGGFSGEIINTMFGIDGVMPAPYVVAMVRGLAQDPEIPEVIDEIFRFMVRRKELTMWMRHHLFIALWDDYALLARMFLQEYHSFMETRLSQDRQQREMLLKRAERMKCTGANCQMTVVNKTV